jgi:hypothetical protein
MSAVPSLAAHPRLYIGPEAIERARVRPDRPALRRAWREVRKEAETYLATTAIEVDETGHNYHLMRARRCQKRILTLILRFLQTGREAYRAAALAHVRAMGAWEYWSWIAWRQGETSPTAIFDLSYGENCVTLALAWDLLHATLCEEEKDLFRAPVRERAAPAFLEQTEPGAEMWWFGKPDSNWNTVCAGGAGMLALAMAEELPRAAEMLRRAESSVTPFLEHLERTDGGWEEGVGYWNYGMRYAFMYLLSHERATGRRHPLLARQSVRRTLRFPLDFSPHGTAAGFGDVNRWQPLAFHYAAAARLECPGVLAGLDEHLDAEARTHWPNAAELLLLHPRTAAAAAAGRERVARIYRGLDWGILADRQPRPHLFCSVRGGRTDVPHGHLDLLSYNVVVDGEALVTEPRSGGYLDTTFSPRRNELFEISPAAKNTLLVNGVGIAPHSEAAISRVRLAEECRALRLDGTAAMGQMRDGPACRFCGRLFVLLPENALLVVDRIEAHRAALAETRVHTAAELQAVGQGALLRGETATARLAFAADVPALAAVGTDPLTLPLAPSTHLRWVSRGKVMAATFATLITPGRRRSGLTVAPRGRALVVEAAQKGWRRRLALTPRLRASRSGA